MQPRLDKLYNFLSKVRIRHALQDCMLDIQLSDNTSRQWKTKEAKQCQWECSWGTFRVEQNDLCQALRNAYSRLFGAPDPDHGLAEYDILQAFATEIITTQRIPKVTFAYNSETWVEIPKNPIEDIPF